MAKKKTSSKANPAGGKSKSAAAGTSAKPTTKGSATSGKPAKKPASAPRATARKTSTATGKSATKAKSTPRTRTHAAKPSNGKSVPAVSERVARIRATLLRRSSAEARIELPKEPLTEAQLRKAKSGLSKADLDHYRNLLIQKRAEILGDVEALSSDARNGGGNISYEHMADTGTDNYEQEFNLELVESERALLTKINDALVRIRNGTYGVCVETGRPIGKARLDAKPYAKYCIEVAREFERQGKDV